MEMSPEAEIRNKSPVKESTNQNQFLSKVCSLPNRLNLSNVTPSRTLTNDSSKLNIQTPSLASNMISSNTFGCKFPPPQGIIDNSNAISPKRTFGSNIPTSSKSTSSDINMQARQIVCPNSTLQNAAQKKLSDKSTNPFLIKTASAPNLFRSIGTNSAANNQNEFSFGSTGNNSGDELFSSNNRRSKR